MSAFQPSPGTPIPCAGRGAGSRSSGRSASRATAIPRRRTRCSTTRSARSRSSAFPTTISPPPTRSGAPVLPARARLPRRGRHLSRRPRMSTQIRPGDTIDGFTIEDCLHAGGNGYVYRVRPPPTRDPGFPLVMKVPGIGPRRAHARRRELRDRADDPAAAHGPHVPRVVAVGDDPRAPVPRDGGDRRRGPRQRGRARAARRPTELARIGAALADAVHSVHRQQVDPSRPQARELSSCAPTAMRCCSTSASRGTRATRTCWRRQDTFAAGSAAYVSPEQLQGQPQRSAQRRVRARASCSTSSPPASRRSASPRPTPECATGCGACRHRRAASCRRCRPGCRRSSCTASRPTRSAATQSAAHVAFDLRHPDQVQLTPRAEWTAGAGIGRQLRSWWRSRRRARADRRAARRRRRRAGHPGRRRHRASGRRTPSGAAARDAALVAMNAEFRLMFVSAIRRRRWAKARGSRTRRRASISSTATGCACGSRRSSCPQSRTSLHVVESARSGGNAARPRAREPRRPHRARRARPVGTRARVVALGRVRRSPPKRPAAFTSCASRARRSALPSRASEPTHHGNRVNRRPEGAAP